jgi:hypothetical protein
MSLGLQSRPLHLNSCFAPHHGPLLADDSEGEDAPIGLRRGPAKFSEEPPRSTKPGKRRVSGESSTVSNWKHDRRLLGFSASVSQSGAWHTLAASSHVTGMLVYVSGTSESRQSNQRRKVAAFRIESSQNLKCGLRNFLQFQGVRFLVGLLLCQSDHFVR